MRKKFCKDCDKPSVFHIRLWCDEIMDRLMPRIRLPFKAEKIFDIFLENIFTRSGLTSFSENFTDSDIPLRSSCFIKEARKRGVSIKGIRGKGGFTNHFIATVNGKSYRFESLPLADFVSKGDVSFVDDKERTKSHLEKGGFPVSEGKSFWFWQKKEALLYGVNSLGFPLVVKPCNGSVARHVATNINSPDDLEKAIDHAFKYGPTVMVERFVPGSVHRATVIDFDFVACVKQVPAHVKGDGISSVRKLIDIKNNDRKRGDKGQKEYTLYRTEENETTERLMKEQGYDYKSIPGKDSIVWLQKDPFLNLGGDLVELTDKMHEDNKKLFQDIAKFFDIRVVGIDFICTDIGVSWKSQGCAALELNSVPCIELHHFPSYGSSQNVAGALVDLFYKYYV